MMEGANRTVSLWFLRNEGRSSHALISRGWNAMMEGANRAVRLWLVLNEGGGSVMGIMVGPEISSMGLLRLPRAAMQ